MPYVMINRFHPEKELLPNEENSVFSEKDIMEAVTIVQGGEILSRLIMFQISIITFQLFVDQVEYY